jgi:hypothetical protein
VRVARMFVDDRNRHLFDLRLAVRRRAAWRLRCRAAILRTYRFMMSSRTCSRDLNDFKSNATTKRGKNSSAGEPYKVV